MEFVLSYATAVLIITMIGRIIYLNLGVHLELVLAIALLILLILILWLFGLSIVYSIMLSSLAIWAMMEIIK